MPFDLYKGSFKIKYFKTVWESSPEQPPQHKVYVRCHVIGDVTTPEVLLRHELILTWRGI